MARRSFVFASAFLFAAGGLACTNDYGSIVTTTGSASSTSSATGGGSASSSASSSGSSVGGGGSSAQSSSSTGGATSSSGTGGTGAGGGTGGGPVEGDCTNGVDDDQDGLDDCVDPDCAAAVQCVDSVPNGWQSYARVIIEAAGNANPEPCDGAAAAPTVKDAAPNDPWTCSACTCGPWLGATCTTPTLRCWDFFNCGGGTVDMQGTLADGQCHKPGMQQDGTGSCQLLADSAPSNQGSCMPSKTDVVETAPFASQVDECAVAPIANGGCGGTQTCVPVGVGNYQGSLCVLADGVKACPPEFPNQTLVYDGASDQRSCSSCTCGVQGVTCTNPQYKFYTSDNCGGANTDVNSTACKDVGAFMDQNTFSMMKIADATPMNGTCNIGGGAPTGSLMLQGPKTVCCK